MLKNQSKTVIIAVNARYSHSSLAVRYLQNYCCEFDVDIAEFSINDKISRIYGELLGKKCDNYVFSTYIWNAEIVYKIAQMLKISTDATIILGGPEVSYLKEEIPFVHHIIRGEGEDALLDFLKYGSEKYFLNENFATTDLSKVDFPYKEFDSVKNKIVYFETTRGCPYSCSYCLSAAECGVREFPMDYVKNGLDKFFKAKIPLVKLIDRTFNYSESRCLEIIHYIVENSTETKVHFEIEPSLLTEKIAQALNDAPAELFQLEMGIQSTNQETLRSINRIADCEKVAENIGRIREIHVHLDLICGLPYEDLLSFSKSFDFVYSMKPNMLQVGFLKVLHGTPIEKTQDIKYQPFPPYQVICTKWLTADEMLIVQNVDVAVDILYNSGSFKRSLDKIINTMVATGEKSPFYVFAILGSLLTANDTLKKRDIYQLLDENFVDITKELTLDFIENNQNTPMPLFMRGETVENFKKKCGSIAKPQNNIRFEPTKFGVVMYNYETKIFENIELKI